MAEPTKAVKSLGPYPSKIHKEELLELLDLWEFAPGVKEKIAGLVNESAGQLKGPHLFRYYGPRPSKVLEAEKAFAEYIGVKHALAVNSCTSALIAALRALGVGMGDEVIVPAYTFFASAAVIGACNAIPVIADVDDTLTLDPKDLERRITERTKAVAVVHMRGAPAQMDEIMRLARRRKLAVVEDVAQACGGSRRARGGSSWSTCAASRRRWTSSWRSPASTSSSSWRMWRRRPGARTRAGCSGRSARWAASASTITRS